MGSFLDDAPDVVGLEFALLISLTPFYLVLC